MKSIALNVTEHAPMEASLQAAVNLCHAFDARLTCVQAELVDALDCYRRSDGIQLKENVVEAVYQRQELLRVKLDQRLRLESVRWTWHKVNQLPAVAIAEEALASDLVVLGLSDFAGSVEACHLVSEVAATVPAPVLAVPEIQCPFECRGKAIVAWNGSSVAMNALRKCLPLLAQAHGIAIVTVEDADIYQTATVAAEYLSIKGIHAELREVKRQGRGTSEALIEELQATGAAYLVVGAFSHSRFREAILGGVTRDLIHSACVPLVLAH